MNQPATSAPALRPIIWSVAGTDSGGGAGLSADARAARAADVHLCPVVAAVTAQHSRAVLHVQPVQQMTLRAQFAALSADMPPAAIKTGLLASVEAVQEVARCVDVLRAAGREVPLVVDPVLSASTGASFGGDGYVQALREHLLPRATLITPNVREARQITGLGDDAPAPALAAKLRELGAQSVIVTGGDTPGVGGSDARWALDWADTPHARGWLALPRTAARHTHGSGCTFASSAAAALARGFVTADALVLAKMATAHALECGYAAGSGAGPANAQPDFACRPSLMPLLTLGEEPPDAALLEHAHPVAPPFMEGACTLYAIVDSATRAVQAAAAGIPIVQLRVKAPESDDALRREIVHALAACQNAGATLVVNDHWQLALNVLDEYPDAAQHLAVHLGQEDMQAMSALGRQRLVSSRIRIGVSSHSLWELARARSLRPWYIACGPVWPTTTKDMPWRPQGLHNLRWWQRMAGCPVVAIGGILEAAQAQQAATAGAAAVCLLRGLGDDVAASARHWHAAIAGAPKEEAPLPFDTWPQPSLDPRQS